MCCDAPYGTPCFPFYRPRESTGYSGEKIGEEEGEEVLQDHGVLLFPSHGSRRPCRRQQGQLHVAALSVTSAMRRHQMPIMALHSILANVMVN